MTDNKHPHNTPKQALARPKTIKWLWVLGLAAIAAITGLSLSVPHHDAKFGIEVTPAFYSWYGFVTCAVIVVFAKFVVGKMLSKKDTYYDQ